MESKNFSEIIEENWDIGSIKEVTRCTNGVTNITYKIVCEKDGSETPYIVKCYEPRTKEEAVRYEHAYMEYIKPQGGDMISVPLHTKSGDTLIQHDYDGKLLFWDLATFLPGDVKYTWIFNYVNDLSITTTAAGLARFHGWGAGFKNSYEPATYIDRFWDLKNEIDHNLSDLIEAGKHRKFTDYVQTKLSYLWEMYDRSSAVLKDSMDDLPECMIHQDFNPGNLMYFDDGALAGIFDLDWMVVGKRLYDVVWCAQQMLSSWDEDHFGQIDPAQLEAYLRSYNEAAASSAYGALNELECSTFSAMMIAQELLICADFVDLVHEDREKNQFEYYLFFLKHIRMLEDVTEKYDKFNQIALETSKNVNNK
jgi:Ser/Thr protein kinase RdoA (MazF antagonist)